MKTEKREDRRVRKTKKALEDGLIVMLAEKELHKISVRELTDKVDVHRGTFYVHYEDIYNLYRSIEERVIAEVNQLLVREYSSETSDLSSFYKPLFSYILENHKLCKLLFDENGNSYFLGSLRKVSIEFCVENWSKDYGMDLKDKRLELYARFYISGFFGIVSKWIEEDFSYSMEEIIDLVSEIDEYFCNLLVVKNEIP